MNITKRVNNISILPTLDLYCCVRYIVIGMLFDLVGGRVI